MANYRIITDMCCDLTEKIVRDLDILAMPMGFDINGEAHKHYIDAHEMDLSEFYAKMRAGGMTKTSAINIDMCMEMVEPILAAGEDVLYLAFSSGLSSTYQTGVLVAEELIRKYPARRMLVVDTLAASLGQGLIVYLCCQQKKAGKSLDEVCAYAEDIRLKLCHWFTVDDLMFLKRGGRVSAATAIVGTLLNIKPILHVDNEGHLVNVGTARGRKASIRALVTEMEKRGIDIENQTIFISHGDCEADAEYLKKLITEKYSVKDIRIGCIGPVIGSHSGPGTLALFFLGTER